MAGKITELDPESSPDVADLLELVVDVGGSPTNKKVTVGDLLAVLGDTLGTAAAANTGDFDAAGSAAAAQAASQPLDADLTAIAALSTTSTGRSLLAGADAAALRAITEAAAAVIAPNTVTANYTLVASDSGKAVEMNNAAARTVTVPPNSSVAFPTGTVVEVCRLGSGTVQILAGSGVTLRSPDGNLYVGTQYGTVSLRKRATNEWVVAGDLSAS